MAVKTLDELVSGLSGPEKALLEKTLRDNPEIRDGWTRQDDYSRKMTELKAKETEYGEALTYNEQMRTWADTNVPRWQALEAKGYIDPETGEETVTERLRTLNEQLEEEKRKALAGGVDMDPEELDRRVKAITKDAGVLTKEELAAVIRTEAEKLAEDKISARFQTEEEKFNSKTIPFVWGGGASVSILAAHYEKETGKPWDSTKSQELFNLMSAEKEFDALKLEEKFMTPHRSTKQQTEKDEEITRLKEENERLKAGRSGGGLPGGGDEPYIPQPPGKGNIFKMMERQQDAPDFESLVMGKAAEAAKQLASEGKA